MQPFRILITGSRAFADKAVVIRALSDACGIPDLDDTRRYVIRHGGAKGADSLAHAVWMDWRLAFGPRWLEPEVFEAKWDLHGKKAGPLRNQQMIEDLKPGDRIDFALAFPLRTSRGTWDCIRKIEAAGIPWANAVVSDPDVCRPTVWRELVDNDPRNRKDRAA